jgi:hypothetical protein
MSMTVKSKKELEAIREGTRDAFVGLYHSMAGFHMTDAIREGTRDAILELFKGAAACDALEYAVRVGTREAISEYMSRQHVNDVLRQLTMEWKAASK